MTNENRKPHSVIFVLPDDTMVAAAVPDGENLLAAAFNARAGFDFHCTSGRCCRCRVQVLEGVEHLSEPTKSERERLGEDGLRMGLRLACQASVHGPLKVQQ